MSGRPERWDIFCRVVDNFGDAGVAFRLARCLAREHGKRVRLHLDDLAVLARLRPGASAGADRQEIDGVDVRLWREGFAEPGSAPVDEVADVVVETFGCETPEAYVLAMAGRRPRPRWINLEYLSAEDWVEESHALPSPHPRFAPLTRHFFFPGFTARTGGLLREGDLLARRDAFVADPLARTTFWRSLGVEPPAPGALTVSLFGYPGAPFAPLLEVLSRHEAPVWAIAPEGAAAEALAAWLAGRSGATGAVRGFRVPFLAQERYDELLWASDVNVVRGEDSFVRAQWAARPFLWQPYLQADGAHWVKLRAFLARYGESLGASDAGALAEMWEAWNRGGGLAPAWMAVAARRGALEAHARRWAAGLASRPDLATALVDFADNVLI